MGIKSEKSSAHVPHHQKIEATADSPGDDVGYAQPCRMDGNRNLYLRDLESVRFKPDEVRTTALFRARFRRHVLPMLNLTGYKLPEKRRLAAAMINTLVLAHQRGACVADGRRKDDAGVGLRAAVWDAITAAGLARKCTGSESSGKTTRYFARRRLADMFLDLDLRNMVDQRLPRNSKLRTPTMMGVVVLHNGQDNQLPLQMNRTPPTARRMRENRTTATTTGEPIALPRGSGQNGCRNIPAQRFQKNKNPPPSAESIASGRFRGGPTSSSVDTRRSSSSSRPSSCSGIRIARRHQGYG